MKNQTHRELIEQKIFVISGWMSKRGRAKLAEDEKSFKKAHDTINVYLRELKQLMFEQDFWNE